MPYLPDNQSASQDSEVLPATVTVGRIMSRRPVTVSMDDTLAKAQALFAEFHFHHLLVIEGRRLVGVISDRDVLKASSPFTGTLNETDRDAATLHKRIHQIMSRRLITVDSGTCIRTATELLIEKGVSCLPVVTEDGTAEGIISWRDLLKAYLNFFPTSR